MTHSLHDAASGVEQAPHVAAAGAPLVMQYWPLIAFALIAAAAWGAIRTEMSDTRAKLDGIETKVDKLGAQVNIMIGQQGGHPP